MAAALTPQFSVQRLAIWGLWTLFDGRRICTEREVNGGRKAANAFGDPVTLRRELINHALMSRTRDGAKYRKLKPQPNVETKALWQAWRQLCRGRSTPRVAPDDSPRWRQSAAAAASASASAI